MTPPTNEDLEEMLSRAAKRGAREALQSIGLHDDQAIHDVRDLRSLLEAWRATKRTAWRKAVEVSTMVFLGALAAGTVFQIKGWK
jgi:hypothetical protein